MYIHFKNLSKEYKNIFLMKHIDKFKILFILFLNNWIYIFLAF